MNNPSFWIAVAAALLGCYTAACNTALRSFNRAKLSEMLEASGKDQWLEMYTDQGDRLILVTGTIRAALNLIVLLAILYVIETNASAWSLPLKYLVAFVIAGVVISVFGVSIPTSLAQHLPERLLLVSTVPLRLGLTIFTPVIKPLHVLDPVIRRLSGADAQPDPKDAISQEVLSVVAEHEDGGQVDPAQKQMIEAVFELPLTTADEIMTPRTEVQAIPIVASPAEVRNALLRDGHSRIPVYDQTIDNIVGILYAKDLIQYLDSGKPLDIKGVLREALMVPKSKSVRELLAEFKARKVHIAIVLDEYGGTAGLVTIEDVIEELVGEIQDEFESTPDDPKIRWLDEHTAEVDARVHVDDLADELGMSVPEHTDYDTVGGFVFSTLGHIPDVGEHFEVDRLRFTVTEAQRNRVKSVRVEKLDEQFETQTASEPAQDG